MDIYDESIFSASIIQETNCLSSIVLLKIAIPIKKFCIFGKKSTQSIILSLTFSSRENVQM